MTSFEKALQPITDHRWADELKLAHEQALEEELERWRAKHLLVLGVGLSITNEEWEAEDA